MRQSTAAKAHPRAHPAPDVVWCRGAMPVPSCSQPHCNEHPWQTSAPLLTRSATLCPMPTSDSREQVPAPPSDVSRIVMDRGDLPEDAESMAAECVRKIESNGVTVVRGFGTDTEALISAFEANGYKLWESHFGRFEDLRTDNTTNKNTDQVRTVTDLVSACPLHAMCPANLQLHHFGTAAAHRVPHCNRASAGAYTSHRAPVARGTCIACLAARTARSPRSADAHADPSRRCRTAWLHQCRHRPAHRHAVC